MSEKLTTKQVVAQTLEYMDYILEDMETWSEGDAVAYLQNIGVYNQDGTRSSNYYSEIN